MSRRASQLDTICAIATAVGEAAVAIVRISGPAAYDIARRLAPALPEAPKPGRASVRQLLRDGVVLDGSFGDVEGRAPTSDTVYRIASMTKSFTCAAILALRDEGVFSLDDPIEAHAPELAVVRAPTSDAGPIRIRHLMTMSSGLATDDAWADRHLDISIDDLDAALRVGTLFAAAPGTVWEYSNLGFGLLGRVVKRATGRRVQDLVSERLLGPEHPRGPQQLIRTTQQGAQRLECPTNRPPPPPPPPPPGARHP
jgi:CubicO group peptidase (beta-lactamase class C family)